MRHASIRFQCTTQMFKIKFRHRTTLRLAQSAEEQKQHATEQTFSGCSPTAFHGASAWVPQDAWVYT
eukprot:2468197-Amphidinium_carterae.2